MMHSEGAALSGNSIGTSIVYRAKYPATHSTMQDRKGNTMKKRKNRFRFSSSRLPLGHNIPDIPRCPGCPASIWLGWSLRPEVYALLMSASPILVAVNAVLLQRSEGDLLKTAQLAHA